MEKPSLSGFTVLAWLLALVGLVALAMAAWRPVGFAEQTSMSSRQRLQQLLEAQARRAQAGGTEVEKIEKTDEAWREELDDLAYRVTREHGTERPFTGAHLNEKRSGYFTAVGGTLPLFRSETKFDSGTGWPSFYDVVDPSHVTLHEDHSMGMRRVEVRCAQTGHHLGHVFEDGPAPTGLRYCINSAAIRFIPEESD